MSLMPMLQRMQTGDVRSVPLLTWPLLALAIAGVILQLQRAGSFLDVSSLPSIVAFVGPLGFAAAIAFVAPADRKLLFGAIAIAFPIALRVMQEALLSARMPQLADAAGSLASVNWVATLVGTVLIGQAIGGVQSRLGRLIVLGGVAAVVADYVVYVGRMPGLIPSDLGVDGLTIALSFLGPTLFIGWAYLLGAAFDRRMRLMAFGSAVILTTSVLGILAGLVFQATPSQPTDFRIWNLVVGVVHLLGWLALIAGAVTELNKKPMTTDKLA